VNARRVAVSSTDWLGLCAWLIDQIVIVKTLAVTCLSSTDWTSLHVAAEDVQLAFRNAAVVTRLSICSPIFFLLSVANARQNFAADAKYCGDSFFCHGNVHRPNEKEVSYRHRERAVLEVKIF
jgi:hypothetical protein